MVLVNSISMTGTAAFNAAISSCALGKHWEASLGLLQQIPGSDFGVLNPRGYIEYMGYVNVRFRGGFRVKG